MLAEALVEQGGKFIYHATILAETLQDALTKVEKYVIMEGLNDIGECNLRVHAGAIIAVKKIDLSGFSKYTWDAINGGNR